jgi:hypothetical protein
MQRMKKFISFLTIFVLIAHIGLFAEATEQLEATSPAALAAQPASVTPAESITKNSAIGTGAAKSSQTGRTTSWQNWVFGGTALVLAAIGIVVVTINSGADSPTHD